jgi:hypothetical protein
MKTAAIANGDVEKRVELPFVGLKGPDRLARKGPFSGRSLHLVPTRGWGVGVDESSTSTLGHGREVSVTAITKWLRPTYT